MVRVNNAGLVEQSKSGKYSTAHPRRKYNTIYKIVYDRSKDKGTLWIGHTQFVFDKGWVGKKVHVHFKEADMRFEVDENGNV